MAHERIVSPKAEADLDTIWWFIARDSEKAADAVVDAITDAFLMLTDNPNAGRPRSDIARTVRSFPVGNHLVFYRTGTRGIRIPRVVHGRQDVSRKDIIG